MTNTFPLPKCIRRLQQLPLHGDESIVDGGCGTGQFAAMLLELMPASRVICIDISERMLAAASVRLLPRFSGRVQLLCADLLDVELTSCADVFFTVGALHWIKDQTRLFARIYRLLRPGGWLVGECGAGADSGVLRQFARTHGLDSLLVEQWSDPWPYPSPGATTQALQAAGFLNVEAIRCEAAITSGAKDRYEEYRFILESDERLQSAVRERSRLQYPTEFGVAVGSDSELQLAYTRLELRAQKPDS